MHVSRKITTNGPGQLSMLTLSLATALSVLAAPRAWAVDVPGSQSTYSWDSVTDVDVSISSGVTIGGTNVSTALSTGNNSSGLGTLTNQGLITGLLLDNGSSATLVDNGTLGTITGRAAISGALGTFNNSGGIHGVSSNGVLVGAGSIGTLTNGGTIDGFNGIYNYSTIGALDNSGQISGTISGIYNAASAEISTLSNSGTIGAGTVAIFSRGTIGTLINSGVLSGARTGIENYGGTIGSVSNTGAVAGARYGIYNVNSGTSTGVIDTLNNLGTLANITGSIAIYNGTGATISTLTNSGTIHGSSSGIANAGSIGSLSNSGLISGTAYGVYNSAGGVIATLDNLGTLATISGSKAVLNIVGATINTLSNSGFILGTSAGVQNTGSIGTLSNSGLISGVNNGIYNSGTIAALVNSGVIASTSSVAIDNRGTIGTLNNSGTIATLSNAGVIGTGAIGTAIQNSGSIGLLSNSGTITGTAGIYNSSAYTVSSVMLAAGTIGTLVNSGTIHGASSGINNAGSIGTLNNTGTITGARAISNGFFSNGAPSTIDVLINGATGVISGSTSGVRNFANGSIGLLSNAGSIHGDVSGIWNEGSIATLSNSGRITADLNSGIYNAGTINIFDNSGTITATHTIASSIVAGLYNSGYINTLSNTGSISGQYGIHNTGSIGVLSNSSSGSVSGVISAVATGIWNEGAIGWLSNSGTVIGVSGIHNQGSIATLSNTGLISGAADGIYNDGVIDALNNLGALGQIAGTIAVFNNSGATISSFTNSGTISGSSTGIFTDGTIGALNNSGLISGQIFALAIGGNGVINSITNSGTIAGVIVNASSNALAISGGTGSTFGTLTGLNGSIGQLYSNADVSFNSGNLLLNDNIGLGLNFVSGTLVASGVGTVTNAGAVLQVNNPITIIGNYQQNAAGTLAIGVSDSAVTNGVNADLGYGRLIVTGNATIDSGSGVTLKKLNTYSFATGQRFVVVQAATATYNAGTLVYSVEGYSASGATVADGSNQDLVVTIGAATGSGSGSGSGTTTPSTPTNAATDSSSGGVFKGLFSYTGVNQSLLDVFNPALALTDPVAANQAGQKLSPTATKGAAASGAQSAANAVGGAANDRIDTQRGGGGGDSGVATGETTLSPALWGRAFGGRANQGERDGIAGFHANYGGVLIGGDALVNPDWRVGGLFSYAHTNVGNDGSNRGSSANVNAYGLMAYAGYDGKPWYLNLTAGVSRQNYSTTRSISFTGFSGIANGSYNGSVTTASAQAGYPLDVGATTVTPLAGLKYSGLRQDGYTETGGSGAALTVNGSTSSSVKSEIGVKAEQSFLTSYGMLKPSVQLGWNHEFRDTRQTTSASFAADTTGSTAFTTLGVTPLKDTAQLSLAATLLQSKNLTLSARYTIEAASGYTAQTGDLTLRWQY